MGSRADVRTFAHPHTLVLAAALTGAAILGKMACALAPGRGTNRLAVAIGMIPRGEVTLIYASLGLSLRVIDRSTYSALVLAVVVTTLVTPTALKWSLR
jgi:Kef-type K+ transport system membrane component KefB